MFMALQLFDQVDLKVAKLVKNLQELGREYLSEHPISTKGKFTFFPHTNQPIAQRLINLDIDINNNAAELMRTLRLLFNEFSAVGTLLKGAYHLVSSSGLYPDMVIRMQQIDQKIAHDQGTDDGSRPKTKWYLSDFQLVLKPVVDSQLSVAVPCNIETLVVTSAVLEEIEMSEINSAVPVVQATPF
jgi:hypothetical protein